ncbi:FeoA family protein [Synoicihabitans lomoniglobus]|uniref:FeoA family protein n=1 Tax=Synoicihabitans lomoniglobus TaxID=2909285 RepID=A0AAF0CNK4_9BACT|nr:ferrous iron transport protein A [Opitutaceae bacterium LMO-M01]WED64520.1 FeoA family protein [Opitutaceae bacterium LMO-M01]
MTIPANIIPLCQLPAGESGFVAELIGEGTFRQHVRELGFGESALVTKISGQTTIICRVNGTRIALSHRAASQILVKQTDKYLG